MAIQPIVETQEIKFIQDTNVKGIGTLTVSINGIQHTKRVNANVDKELDTFVAEAKAKASAVEQEKADIETIVTKVSTKLNTVVE